MYLKYENVEQLPPATVSAKEFFQVLPAELETMKYNPLMMRQTDCLTEV